MLAPASATKRANGIIGFHGKANGRRSPALSNSTPKHPPKTVAEVNHSAHGDQRPAFAHEIATTRTVVCPKRKTSCVLNLLRLDSCVAHIRQSHLNM